MAVSVIQWVMWHLSRDQQKVSQRIITAEYLESHRNQCIQNKVKEETDYEVQEDKIIWSLLLVQHETIEMFEQWCHMSKHS